ncbi:MAG TPA: ParA family protein [Gammaproteobacteria bacterium]|nr:ParA family protein [Gammaproteobacteria bacterium]
MRHILVINPKGGCGKSTIATSLAAYFASEGYATALADYDPQASALSWLEERPADFAPITPVPGFESGLKAVPRSAEYVVIDSPAATRGKELTELVRRAETIIVPVLPSPIDIKAAERFVEELLDIAKVADKKAKAALVANRVKENTLIFEELDGVLSRLKVPYVASFREAQNYIRAYQRGLGIHELPPYLAWPDWEQWDPLIEWLDSRRSLPKAS